MIMFSVIYMENLKSWGKCSYSRNGIYRRMNLRLNTIILYYKIISAYPNQTRKCAHDCSLSWIDMSKILCSLLILINIFHMINYRRVVTLFILFIIEA